MFLITGEFCYYDGEVSVRRAKITTGLRKKIKITTVKNRTSDHDDDDDTYGELEPPAVGPNKQQPLGHRQYKDIRVTLCRRRHPGSLPVSPQPRHTLHRDWQDSERRRRRRRSHAHGAVGGGAGSPTVLGLGRVCKVAR